MSVCNHDCFNCIFADCICNDSPRDDECADEYLDLPKPTAATIWKKAHPERRAIHNARYYQKRKERMKREKAGLRYETCFICGKRWNVSIDTKRADKYICPECQNKDKK